MCTHDSISLCWLIMLLKFSLKAFFETFTRFKNPLCPSADRSVSNASLDPLLNDFSCKKQIHKSLSVGPSIGLWWIFFQPQIQVNSSKFKPFLQQLASVYLLVIRECRLNCYMLHFHLAKRNTFFHDQNFRFKIFLW